MLTKPGWNHLEVRTMRGVLSALRRKPDESLTLRAPLSMGAPSQLTPHPGEAAVATDVTGHGGAVPGIEALAAVRGA